jgi:hypothetical protein
MPGKRMLHDDLVVLNRYYIETRYPGDYPEFDMSEANAAFRSALSVKQFSLKRTSQEHEL